MKKIASNLSLKGIPATMLATLYIRVQEAKQSNGILKDPLAVQIHDAFDFDFEGYFGKHPRGGMASRAVHFDLLLKKWLKDHPKGLIVSLGEGLETQRERVDNGTMRWLSIDLPEAIELRENFLKQSDRFKHLKENAFNPIWMKQIDPTHGLMIVAQGLFMYFSESEVKQLIKEIFEHFPKAEMLLDFVSKSFAEKTQKGLHLTERYSLPQMHWGINYDEVKNTMRSWVPDKSCHILHYDIFPRGLSNLIFDRFLRKILYFSNQQPGIAHLYSSID